MKYDKILQALAEKHVRYFILKLDAELFEDECFVDNCHLNERGEKKLIRFQVSFEINVVAVSR